MDVSGGKSKARRHDGAPAAITKSRTGEEIC
jgi:hypothetical protein